MAIAHHIDIETLIVCYFIFLLCRLGLHNYVSIAIYSFMRDALKYKATHIYHSQSNYAIKIKIHRTLKT